MNSMRQTRTWRFGLPLCALIAGLLAPAPAEAAAGPGIFDVRDFGARGDGTNMDTVAIQKAIDAAEGAGGGIVRLPPGRYLSGSIDLKSRITLEIQKDAVLLGSTRQQDYRRLDMNGRHNFHALLLAYRRQDFAITGAGTIDGQGTALALDTERRMKEGAIPDAREGQRPMVIHFRECSGVTVANVTLRNSSCWMQEYRNCDRLVVEGLRVFSHASRNNDGIDIDGCSNAVVRHCDIDSEDDGICLKSVERPCENVLVERCRVRSSCNAVKFGTASEKGFVNITVRDIEVYDTYLSGIALEIVDGGRMEKVNVSRIRISGTHNALFVRLGHRNTKGAAGTIDGVVLSDITAEIPALPWPEHMAGKFSPLHTYKHRMLITSSITGVPGHPVRNVTIRNLSLVYGGIGDQCNTRYPGLDRLDEVPECRDAYPESQMWGTLPAWGFYCRHAEGIAFENVRLRVQGTDYRPALVCDDVKDLRLQGFRAASAGREPVIVLKDVNGAVIRDSPPPPAARTFLQPMGRTQNLHAP